MEKIRGRIRAGLAIADRGEHDGEISCLPGALPA
jgi:hypothetical protein